MKTFFCNSEKAITPRSGIKELKSFPSVNKYSVSRKFSINTFPTWWQRTGKTRQNNIRHKHFSARQRKTKQMSLPQHLRDIRVDRWVSRRHGLKLGVIWQKKLSRHIFTYLHSYLWLNLWSSFRGNVISAVWVYILVLFYHLMGNCIISKHTEWKDLHDTISSLSCFR